MPVAPLAVVGLEVRLELLLGITWEYSSHRRKGGGNIFIWLAFPRTRVLFRLGFGLVLHYLGESLL